VRKASKLLRAGPPWDWRGWLDKNFHFCFVAACCVLIAVLLGVQQPEFKYQKAVSRQHWLENGMQLARDGLATASQQTLLIGIVPSQDSNASAKIIGRGSADAITLDDRASGKENVTRLVVNGKAVCAPCKAGKEYLLGQQGDLDVYFEARNHTETEKAQPGFALGDAYFGNLSKTYIEDSMLFSVKGSWKAVENSAMPSSFYRTDAPFHIQRIAVLKEYLPRLQIPWSWYSFLSLLPAGAFEIADGAGPEYSFKVYQISLFFVPIVLFALYSRKLGRNSRSVFFFSSLLYLFLPVHGLMTGGAPDLFFYGMTPYTVATYLSLFFFLFAYEFFQEGRRAHLALASLFFAAAFACNQRVLAPMGIMLACLAFAFALQRRYSRLFAVFSGCFFAVAFFAVPFAIAFLSPGGSAAGTLGGVSITDQAQGVVAFLQAGYLLLPLLFLAGAAAAYAWRQEFALLLSAGAVLVFLFATNPQVNEAFPFVDGLRLLPSFFLASFFIGGLGAAWFYTVLLAMVDRAQQQFKADRPTVAGSAVLMLMLPGAAVFYVVMHSSIEQFQNAGDSVFVALDYDSMKNILDQTGGERLVFESDGLVSQYPVYGFGLAKTPVSWFGSQEERENAMRGLRLRYVVLGGSKPAQPGVPPRPVEYAQLAGNGKFEEMPVVGNARLFALRGGEAGKSVYVENGALEAETVEYDRASLNGTCSGPACEITLFSSLPKSIRCTNFGEECAVTWVDAGELKVANLPKGRFEILLQPFVSFWDWMLVLGCVVGWAATLFLWRFLDAPPRSWKEFRERLSQSFH